jgi:hypothetical protein
MTNAIEQTRREMYNHLESVKASVTGISTPAIYVKRFEEFLEAHLEELRKGLAAANSATVACAQHSAESFIELERRLAAMTEERDVIQLRLHAVDHAYIEQQSKAGTYGQVCGDRGASEKLGGGETTVLVEALKECQSITTSWAVEGLRAKKAIRAISAVVNGKPKVFQALKNIEDPKPCQYCDGLGYVHCNGGRPTAPCPSGCQ